LHLPLAQNPLFHFVSSARFTNPAGCHHAKMARDSPAWDVNTVCSPSGSEPSAQGAIDRIPSHESLRVEGAWMVTGHAAGVAAAISATRKIPVQEVPVKTLQEPLVAQGQVIDFIPGKPETCCGINGPEEF
jgi:hypothetical protein